MRKKRTTLCSCHQAALNRSAIFACMVFRMMRHLRCLWLQIFVWLRFAGFSNTNMLKYIPIPSDFPAQWKITGDRLCIVAESWAESKTKNIKNSLGATWNASHLAVWLCASRHWKRVSMPPTTQSIRHPLTRAHHIAPRIKTARRFTAKNPWW